MNSEYKPFYKWYLKDLDKVKKNNLKVFSCFACGGGSTMGYKLAGFDVIGANDIDPEMAWHYKKNHNPKHYFLEDIRKFRTREDLPKELFDLDILDGSPPCSSFSMAGVREKGWGKKKVFREGQTEQVLDDLFFEFIEFARKLQPKVVIAENVKGMLQGNAKGYVKQIINLFKVSGYDVQLFLLNAASMGVPQKRERVFFICRRRDLNLPELKLGFYQSAIPLKSALVDCEKDKAPVKVPPAFEKYWKLAVPGQTIGQAAKVRNKWFGYMKVNPLQPSPTITSSGTDKLYHWKEYRAFYLSEMKLIGSFPCDYEVKSEKLGKYLIGMSVPPLMTYGVANQVYKQWFKVDNE